MGCSIDKAAARGKRRSGWLADRPGRPVRIQFALKRAKLYSFQFTRKSAWTAAELTFLAPRRFLPQSLGLSLRAAALAEPQLLLGSIGALPTAPFVP